MKLKTLPASLVAELLCHFAEHRSLEKLLEGFGGALTLNEVKRVLFEIAGHLKETANAAPETASSLSLKDDPNLSDKAKELLSCLSPTEEKKLLSRFGLLES